MPSTEPELPRARGRDELLDHIYREGGRRQARRRRVLLASAVVLVLGGVAAATMIGDGDRGGQQVAARGGPTTTPVPPSSVVLMPLPLLDTSTSVPSTTAPRPTTTLRIPPPPPVPTSARPTTTTTTPPTTTEPPVCRNSADPACGEFHWDPPPPPDQPLQIDVQTTVVERTVTFRVVYSDPDTQVRGGCRSIQFGDGEFGPVEPCAVVLCAAAFGPWTPPPPESSTEERTFTHTYAEAGAYVASFSAETQSRCYDPYASSAQKTVEVVLP